MSQFVEGGFVQWGICLIRTGDHKHKRWVIYSAVHLHCQDLELKFLLRIIFYGSVRINLYIAVKFYTCEKLDVRHSRPRINCAGFTRRCNWCRDEEVEVDRCVMGGRISGKHLAGGMTCWDVQVWIGFFLFLSVSCGKTNCYRVVTAGKKRYVNAFVLCEDPVRKFCLI